MAKFKIGDGVRNLVENDFIKKGATGTVNEDDTRPFVMWDSRDMLNKPHPFNRWCQDESDLEPISDTSLDTSPDTSPDTSLDTMPLPLPPKHIKRYIVVLEAYLWAEDDNQAIVTAQRLRSELDKFEDRQASITSLCEQPFGSTELRPVPPFIAMK